MAYGYQSPTNQPTSGGETFFERQRRLQQAAQTQAQPTTVQQNSTSLYPESSPSKPQPNAQPSGGVTNNLQGTVMTPVTGSGKIPDATAMPMAQPAPAAPAPPAQPVVQGSHKNFSWHEGGQGFNTNSWTDAQWESYYQRFPDQRPAGFVDGKWQAAAPAPAGAGGPPPALAGSAASGQHAQAAQGGMFTQFEAPDHDFQNWQQLELVSQLLANPETMSAAVLEKQKQKSMEESMLLAEQLQQQQAEELASRGFSIGGGTADAQRRATNENLMKSILGQNRDLEIQAAQQNRQDQLQALGVAEAILGGQVGRSGNVFQNILAGQQANRDDHWRGKGLDLQRELGVGGLNIDQQRVNNQSRQFDASYGLDILRFLEGGRQADNNLGLAYDQLNLSGNNQLMNYIMSILK